MNEIKFNNVTISSKSKLNFNTVEEFIDFFSSGNDISQINIKITSIEDFYKTFGEYIQKDPNFEKRLIERASTSLLHYRKILYKDENKKNKPIKQFCEDYGIRMFKIKYDVIKGLQDKLDSKEELEAELKKLIEEGKIEVFVVDEKKLSVKYDGKIPEKLKNSIETQKSAKTSITQAQQTPAEQPQEQQTPEEQPQAPQVPKIVDAFGTSIPQIVKNYTESMAVLDDKKSAKANVQANLSQLLNKLVNNETSIIPNINMDELEKAFERINPPSEFRLKSVEKMEYEAGLRSREEWNKIEKEINKYRNAGKKEKLSEQVENLLQAPGNTSIALEPMGFEKKMPPWEKSKVATKYMNRAVVTYEKLLEMREKMNQLIDSKKGRKENTDKEQNFNKVLTRIFDEMMANGNDKLITQYIALNEAMEKLEQNVENPKENQPKKHTVENEH